MSAISALKNVDREGFYRVAKMDLHLTIIRHGTTEWMEKGSISRTNGFAFIGAGNKAGSSCGIHIFRDVSFDGFLFQPDWAGMADR